VTDANQDNERLFIGLYLDEDVDVLLAESVAGARL